VATKYIFNSIQLKSIEIATILFVTFCPYQFVRTILSNTILSGHRKNQLRQQQF